MSMKANVIMPSRVVAKVAAVILVIVVLAIAFGPAPDMGGLAVLMGP
jgi:hypothetical protein